MGYIIADSLYVLQEVRLRSYCQPLDVCALWLCCYRALEDGYAIVVVFIDYLTGLATVLFSTLVLRDTVSRQGIGKVGG